jgi:aminoglycoside phosphotransferase (APT) family kinase protein
VSGQVPESIRRFSTGIAHWVYDIRLPDGASIVVRLGTADQAADFIGALHWSKTLRPLGVPLPVLLAHGEYGGHPYLVLERLAGEDLGQVYHSLTSAERKSLAEQVCRVQRIVGALPEGAGYGFLRLPTEPGRKSWSDVIEASLSRSRRRIEKAGLVNSDPIDRVATHARQFQSYFSRVRPTPFLDDMTTKNVLVHAGRLSGIVDVDWLCFGDSLFTVALTRAALLGSGDDLEYTDHWCEMLDLTKEQQDVVRFYTALFCVDFMSEFGKRFNQGVEPLDLERLGRLEKILNDL